MVAKPSFWSLKSEWWNKAKKQLRPVSKIQDHWNVVVKSKNFINVIEALFAIVMVSSHSCIHRTNWSRRLSWKPIAVGWTTASTFLFVNTRLRNCTEPSCSFSLLSDFVLYRTYQVLAKDSPKWILIFQFGFLKFVRVASGHRYLYWRCHDCVFNETERCTNKKEIAVGTATTGYHPCKDKL